MVTIASRPFFSADRRTTYVICSDGSRRRFNPDTGRLIRRVRKAERKALKRQRAKAHS